MRMWTDLSDEAEIKTDGDADSCVCVGFGSKMQSLQKCKLIGRGHQQLTIDSTTWRFFLTVWSRSAKWRCDLKYKWPYTHFMITLFSFEELYIVLFHMYCNGITHYHIPWCKNVFGRLMHLGFYSIVLRSIYIFIYLLTCLRNVTFIFYYSSAVANIYPNAARALYHPAHMVYYYIISICLGASDAVKPFETHKNN